MGVMDVPNVTTTKNRIANLYARLAGPNTLAIPATAPSADIPTVAWNSSSAYSSSYQMVGPQSGLVTEVGSRGTWNATFSRLPVSGMSGLDFYLTGTACEIIVITNAGTGGANYPFWIWVNGAPVTAAPDTSAPTSSAIYYVTLTFGSSARRRIEFFAPVLAAAWYGVRTSIGSLITPAPRRPVVAFIGDSFFAGATGDITPFQCAPFLMSRMLGVECYSQSLGGTGYVNAGSFINTFGSAARVSSVSVANPELIIIQGSLNDDSQTGIQTAATAAYSAYATACPTAKIIAFGPQPNASTATLSANRQTNNAAVKAAATAASNVLAFHDEIGHASSAVSTWSSSTTYSDGNLVSYLGSVWMASNGGTSFSGSGSTPGTSPRWALQTYVFTGTGNVGGVTGDGTRDTYLYSDGVHPTSEGSAAMAIRCANIIRIDLQAAAL